MPKRKRGSKDSDEKEPGYLSDESEFYGPPSTKRALHRRLSQFSPSHYWSTKLPSLMEIAARNLCSPASSSTPTFFNPYEGDLSCRQLGETVTQFLARLPPATTPVSEIIPWIRIANPYRKTVSSPTNCGSINADTEGPQDEESNWSAFQNFAMGILDELSELRQSIEKQYPGKAAMTITKHFNTQRDVLVQKILHAAVKYKCTTGKWMIFASPLDVNNIWAAVAHRTSNNELGTAAKVAPDDGGDRRKERLICIYTSDFTNLEDVTRVVRKLKDVGVLDNSKRGIFYKCDAYTHLGLTSSNPWGIKASMYNSHDLLKGNGKEAKAEGLFYKKKKDADDWKPVEWE